MMTPTSTGAAERTAMAPNALSAIRARDLAGEVKNMVEDAR